VDSFGGKVAEYPLFYFCRKNEQVVFIGAISMNRALGSLNTPW